MHIPRSAPRAAGAVAIAAVVVGAFANGGAAVSASPPHAPRVRPASTRAVVPNVLPPSLQYLIHPQPRAVGAPQRFVRAKGGGGTVFVSDVNNSTVTCFDEKGKVTGQITSLDGLFEPQGLDYYKGVLYVANTADENILEFQGCSPTPIATLSDNGQFPVDVVRSPDGQVYASNLHSVNGVGSISVYPPGATSPSGTVSAGPNQGNNYFVTLDSSGDLYSDWLDVDGVAHVQCYPAPVTSPGIDQGISIGFPGGIKWYAGNLVVSDQGNGIDQFSGGSCAAGGWTLGPQIPSGDIDWVDIALNRKASAINRTDVDFHNADQVAFPGGSLLRSFVYGFSEPIGVVNSEGPQR